MLVLASLLAIAAGSAHASSEGCAALATCMEAVQTAFDGCDQLAQDVDTAFLDSLMPEQTDEQKLCMGKVKAIRDEKQTHNRQRESEYRACLAERASEAVPLSGDKAELCQQTIADFADEVSRTKRKATKEERKQRRKERNERLAAAGVTMEAWKAMKTQRSALRQCKRAANQLRKKCKPLTGCCSEAKICHLEYEVSPVHDLVKGSSKAIILQKRECARGKGDVEESGDSEVSGEQILDNQLPTGEE